MNGNKTVIDWRRGNSRGRRIEYPAIVPAPWAPPAPVQQTQQTIVREPSSVVKYAQWSLLLSVILGALAALVTALLKAALVTVASVGGVFALLTALAVSLAGLIVDHPLMRWKVERWLGIDIDGDGVAGEPEKQRAPPALPSENVANALYDNAVKLWRYAFAQTEAAKQDGVTLKAKPWARRQPHGLNEDDWAETIELWLEAGLVSDKNSRELQTADYGAGMVKLRRAMQQRGYVWYGKNQSWLPS